MKNVHYVIINIVRGFLGTEKNDYYWGPRFY